jgi:hypothetical protein
MLCGFLCSTAPRITPRSCLVILKVVFVAKQCSPHDIATTTSSGFFLPNHAAIPYSLGKAQLLQIVPALVTE